MAEAYIVDAVRTAGGRRGGKLSGWHPADLGAVRDEARTARTFDDAGVDAIESRSLGAVRGHRQPRSGDGCRRQGVLVRIDGAHAETMLRGQPRGSCAEVAVSAAMMSKPRPSAAEQRPLSTEPDRGCVK